jgi:hypothetical protein
VRQRLASASQGKTARLWDAAGGGPPGATRPESLCAKLTSNMSVMGVRVAGFTLGGTMNG